MATSQVCHATHLRYILSSTWPHCVFFRLWPQHYVWAGGHFVLLVSALRYIFAWAFFKTASPWWYKGSPVYFAIPLRSSLTVTYVQRVLSGRSLVIPSSASK